MANPLIWLVGVGTMGREYAKVLAARGLTPLCIGRGEDVSAAFEAATGLQVHRGGLQRFLETRPSVPEYAIVCVNVETLAGATNLLLEYGIGRILVEKPAALYQAEIDVLVDTAQKRGASVFVAYNRRWYPSVRAAMGIIEEDGGVQSFAFEFTEWSHKIAPLPKPREVKERWFLANSSHVSDLAFFLGGPPRSLDAFTAGCLDWHPAASVFAGAGQTNGGVLFTYCANWGSPGRWGVEVMTPKHRIVLRPLEEVQVIDTGSIIARSVQPAADPAELGLKPGLPLQIERFLSGDPAHFCTLEEQQAMFRFYVKMAGYAG